MAATIWHTITGFSAAATTAPSGTSPLEATVVSLFDQLRIPILRYMLSFRVPLPDGEEIVQEVFLLLFQRLRQGKSHDNLPGWVFKTAHNLALKHHTRARRNAAHFSNLRDLSEVPGDIFPAPNERLDGLEKQERLLAVVRAMPAQDQCCLELRAEGLRYREIAEILGISLGSVANSLERSLARLSRSNY